MTAEIAILNKSAVALAADSAVSIGRAPNLKIFNTVDKIFELSAAEPVGIMIYGRLDYMGLPLETIIKQYRRTLGRQTFPHIRGYRDHFRHYLANNVPIGPDDKTENAMLVLTSSFELEADTINKAILADIRQRGSYQKSKLNGIAQTRIRRRISELQSEAFSPGFTTKQLPAHLTQLVDALISHHFSFLSPTASTKDLLRKLAGYVVAKGHLSTYRSGIVIAGFGTDELFPSLERFELDGMLDGRLKYRDYPEVDISRRGPEADILGFAQDDMMKSFLDGVDPTIRTYMFKLLDTAIEEGARSVLTALLPPAQVDAALANLGPVLSQMQQDTHQKADKYIEDNATSPIRDMVRAMPKQELSNLASSLIEITSLKRKVTREQETVGGEVDVAIISKSEGFVWTRRKHYFSRELNPRFFERHY